jgi:hypothetical protein
LAKIGKTSAVVLTMSGVLKDILLVVASMVFFGDPVTGQQYFGYSLALAGLTYYRLGAEKIQSAVTDARLSLGGFRQNHPARARAIVLCLILGFISLMLLWWKRNTLGTYLNDSSISS